MNTVLGVWAHPDDEAYLSAGLMSTARRRGDRIVVATATRGEMGVDAAPGLRESELAAALAALDVREHHWLDFPDGGCASVPAALGSARVADLVRAVRPDTIVTFGPDGITGHPDHRAVSAWTTSAWNTTGRRARLLYAALTPEFHARWGALCDANGVWMDDERPATPDDQIALTITARGDVLDRKMAALRAHESQSRALIAAVGESTYRSWWATEWFADARAAETLDLRVSA